MSRDHKCFVGNTTTNPDSLDQIVADHIGHLTRVRNVVTFISHAHHHIVASWRNRLPVMPIQSTRVLFETLFAKTDRKTQERLLAHKKSVLDGSLEEAKSLMQRVSGRDRTRLEEYFAAFANRSRNLTNRSNGSASPTRMSSFLSHLHSKTASLLPMSIRNDSWTTRVRFSAASRST